MTATIICLLLLIPYAAWLIASVRALRRHSLGNLAFVMGEHKVEAASVNVEFLAKILLSHHRTLKMPARESFAPR